MGPPQLGLLAQGLGIVLEQQQYQDGQTRVVNGVPYTRQGGQWTPSSGAPSGGTPQPVLPRIPAPRYPDETAVGQGRAAAVPYAAPQAATDLERGKQQLEQSDTRGINFSAENTLRDQYQTLPAVRDYQTVLPMYQTAMRAAPGGAGDLNLVYAFAKVMDPGSVVRESEVQMSQNTGGLGERINGYLASLRNGGSLQPSVRQRIISEIENRIQQYSVAYRGTRKDYWRRAEDYGFSPERILGQDYEESYRPGPNAPGQDGPQFTDPNAPDRQHPANFAGMLAETTPGSEERFRMLEHWMRARQGQASIRIGTGENPDPSNMIDQFGLTEAQEQAMEQEYQRMLRERQPVEGRDEEGAGGLLQQIDAGVRSFANTVTFGGADHVAGALNGRGAEGEHRITNFDWRNNTGGSLAGMVAGAAASGRIYPMGATIRGQTGLGAAYGGLYGFNTADGSLVERLNAGKNGAILGGGVGAVFGLGARALRNPNRQAVIDAGERQDVYVSRHVAGGTPSRMAAGVTGVTPGRIPLERAAQRTVGDLRSARDRTAASIGTVLDDAGAGQRAQAGARTFLRESADRADDLAARIPIHPTQPASLTNTGAALDDLTAGLTSNPRLSAIMEDGQLLAFRDALREGGLSWGDLRRFRSLIGEKIGQPQVAGEATSRSALRRLYGAISDDMRTTAEAQGPRALSAFNRFNQYWRGRESRREGALEAILGRNFDASPEQAFAQINRWAQNDHRTTGQVLRSLPLADRNSVRASLFSRMGTARAGQQEAAGGAFSPSTFATQWNQLSPRAKNFLIPDARHRRNLNDIALLSTAARQAEKFTNWSNSALGVTGTAGVAGMMSHPWQTLLAGAGTYGIGQQLASRAGSATILRALRSPALQQETRDMVAPEEGQ